MSIEPEPVLPEVDAEGFSDGVPAAPSPRRRRRASRAIDSSRFA